MSPSIVVINVSESVAPAPLLYQKTGAFVSQGGTNLAANTKALLTQKGDLTAILANPLAISSIAWSGGVAQVTTAAAIPGLTSPDTLITNISGVTPAGYNGTYIATVTGANTFTFPLAVNPGAETVPGTYSPPGQGELIAMNSSYWAQGTGQAVYVLELGAGDGSTGPALLGTYDTANPDTFYGYLVPRNWDSQATYLALIAEYEALNAQKYFWTTTTASNYVNYLATMKSAPWVIEAPSTQAGGLRPLTEFTAAAFFQIALNYAPSSTNKQTQLRYAYLFGVTQYPTSGNQAFLTTINNLGSVVGSGAEGGISNTIVQGGCTPDGNDFSWWYAVDWLQLNCDQSLSNAVINGSNNPINPLYYDQNGINSLQDVVVATVSSGVSFGLLTGTVTQAALDGPAFTAALSAGTYADMDVVNAVPFVNYTAENPSAYQAGTYGGLAVVAIPQRGFKQIIVNLNVSNLLSV